jgi:hypothetical protein
LRVLQFRMKKIFNTKDELYDFLLNKSDLNEFEPIEAVKMLGSIFEISNECQSVDGLKKGIELSKSLIRDKFNDDDNWKSRTY